MNFEGTEKLKHRDLVLKTYLFNIQNVKKKLLYLDTPTFQCSLYFIKKGISAKNLIAVNFSNELTIPEEAYGITVKNCDIFDLENNDTRDVAVAWLDLCKTGIPRSAKHFTDSISAFSDIPVLFETHSLRGSKFHSIAKRKEMITAYKKRHEYGPRFAESTKIIPYTGGNGSKMVFVYSFLKNCNIASPIKIKKKLIEKVPTSRPRGRPPKNCVWSDKFANYIPDVGSTVRVLWETEDGNELFYKGWVAENKKGLLIIYEDKYSCLHPIQDFLSYYTWKTL